MAVAFITGCSSGFGKAIALAFAQTGHRVIATMRRPEAAPAELAALAARNPDDFLLASLDVTDPGMRANAFDLASRYFGRLDILVNNAGITATGSVEDTTESIWRSIFETNFFAPLELMRLALPIMRRQGAGRIVNVTSVAAMVPTPLLGAYSASKHALDCVSATLDVEARGFGVRVATILPGPFRTELGKKSLPIDASVSYQRIAAQFATAFGGLIAQAPQDLSPVVNAALAAALDPDPACRYAAGADAVPQLSALLDSFVPFHQLGLRLTGQA